jgi:hypothetical protein
LPWPREENGVAVGIDLNGWGSLGGSMAEEVRRMVLLRYENDVRPDVRRLVGQAEELGVLILRERARAAAGDERVMALADVLWDPLVDAAEETGFLRRQVGRSAA